MPIALETIGTYRNSTQYVTASTTSSIITLREGTGYITSAIRPYTDYTTSSSMVWPFISSGTNLAYAGTGSSITSTRVFVIEEGSSYIVSSGNVITAYHEETPQQRIEREKKARAYERTRNRTLYHARKALRKSISLFENLFGEEPIKLFLNGQAIDVEGELFNYKLCKKRNNLLSHTAYPSSGMIPYNLDIYDKNWNKLCGGCTVFKDTPIVDQLIALIMHIKTGEELRILQNTNFFDRTVLFDDNEFLKSVRKI